MLPVLLSHQFSQRTYDTLLALRRRDAGNQFVFADHSRLASARLKAPASGVGGRRAGIMAGALFLMLVDRLRRMSISSRGAKVGRHAP
jgi:hypothetical protein